MSTLYENISLTPHNRMGKKERTGLTLMALGLLAFLLSFITFAGPAMPFLSGIFFTVAGGIVYSRKEKRWPMSSLLLIFLGLISFLFLLARPSALSPFLISLFSFGFFLAGAAIYIFFRFRKGEGGIRNNGITFSPLTRKNGALAWVLAVVITGFYVMLYWFPEEIHGLILAVDPIYKALFGKSGLPQSNGGHYNPWFLYGFLYTIAVLLMGSRFMFKYRHNRYQLLRTASVIFFQVVFAFFIPNILAALNQQELYFHYFWPLDYDVLFPSGIDTLMSGGSLTHFFFWWTLALSFLAVPVLTYYYGKRWYCSWVCGCGGLAETAGDPFRHLSDKSLNAWQIERKLIYLVLVLITAITALLLLDRSFDLFSESTSLAFKKAYGFVIGTIFSGVVGVGFYPIMGSRVWCRFGCPQAAILGILQKYFSRFRISTNGGQCISCGNCSTYCEMGIDVKWYAQREQNIVRASCVGCGICAAVCPRGVLKLENGPAKGRTALQISRTEVKILDEDLIG